MAEDCLAETGAAWRHPLLQHNVGELGRLRRGYRPRSGLAAFYDE
jgi:hypothetical protein